jgi:hypothetical protein
MSDENLRPEDKVAGFDTLRHMETVRNILNVIIVELMKRGRDHDQEKLRDPEVQLFTELTPLIKSTTFGSPEYLEQKARLQVALDHHYARCRHHPQHFPNGVQDMNLIDLIEMLCDWKASSLRQHNGNLLKSIERCSEDFNIPPFLSCILKNTASFLDHANS